MQKRGHNKLVDTETLPKPSAYVELFTGEFAPWSYDEKQGFELKGQWRERAFEVSQQAPVDVEIGTGNGFFFAHRSCTYPDRNLVGLEIKYKPLVQSIRRALRTGARNMRIVRFHASMMDELFAKHEINNVFIHFPDPWPKKRHAKNRLVQRDFLNVLYDLQKPGSFVEFKTDNIDYFNWALEKFEQSPYRITRKTFDLHHSQWAEENFQTHFEKLWASKGLKINMARLEKN